MRPKAKERKPKAKKPKPNLHGPNSPTPKKRVVYTEEDEEPIGSFYTKNDDQNSEN